MNLQILTLGYIVYISLFKFFQNTVFGLSQLQGELLLPPLPWYTDTPYPRLSHLPGTILFPKLSIHHTLLYSAEKKVTVSLYNIRSPLQKSQHTFPIRSRFSIYKNVAPNMFCQVTLTIFKGLLHFFISWVALSLNANL